MRPALIAFSIATTPTTALAFDYPTVGGHEGEIDVSAQFDGYFGDVQPTERPRTFQPADIKVFTIGAGLSFGNLGPFLDFYLRIDGGYFISAPEVVTRPEDDLPVGTLFHGEDKGGWATATIGTNIVHEPRFVFGLFLEGTIPIDVDVAKLSNVRMHYAGGGTVLGVHITDPAALLRLTSLTRFFVGSGVYASAGQQNAQTELESLFYLDLARWILPWRAGLGAGPRFVSDLNDHLDDAYYQAYGSVSPDLVAGDRVRQLALGGAVRAYFFITQSASLELSFDGQITGEDAWATRRYGGALRVAF